MKKILIVSAFCMLGLSVYSSFAQSGGSPAYDNNPPSYIWGSKGLNHQTSGTPPGHSNSGGSSSGGAVVGDVSVNVGMEATNSAIAANRAKMEELFGQWFSDTLEINDEELNALEAELGDFDQAYMEYLTTRKAPAFMQAYMQFWQSMAIGLFGYRTERSSTPISRALFVTENPGPDETAKGLAEILQEINGKIGGSSDSGNSASSDAVASISLAIGTTESDDPDIVKLPLVDAVNAIIPKDKWDREIGWLLNHPNPDILTLDKINIVANSDVALRSFSGLGMHYRMFAEIRAENPEDVFYINYGSPATVSGSMPVKGCIKLEVSGETTIHATADKDMTVFVTSGWR